MKLKLRSSVLSFSIFYLLTLAVLSSHAQTSSPKSPYSEIFNAIWLTVAEKFYDPGFTGVDWKAVGERYRPQAELARSDSEFHAVIEKMLRELPVSHLQISMPRGTRQFGTGIRTAMIEGRNVV